MGKSSRHKSQNIHHFVPFSDRILNANTDVIHQIRRTDNEVETTFFGDALLKWTDLDLTDHFINFRKEIQEQVQTFEQLVHHKDEIIVSLKKHLAVSRSLAVAPLLDLLVQLARDLQQEFVPHFQDFFNILVHLLADYSQNAEILEQIFQTFACLFRFLWRYLVKDFKTVFSYFSQLMQSSQKDYIKVFAAESCAYLLRKVKHQDELLNMLFGSLKTQPELVDGVGLLLFEMVKGVNNRFHTISEKVFPLILQKLGKWNPDMKKEIRLPYNLVEKAVKVLMQECANHATKEHFKPLWQIMFVTVHQVHTAYLRSQQENEEGNIVFIQHLRRLLRLTSVWLMFDSGSIVSDAECIADTLCTILKSQCSAKQLDDDILCTTSNLLQACHDRLSVGTIVQLNSAVLNIPFQFSVLKIFLKDVLNLPFFEKDVLPGLMDRLQSLLTLEDEEEKKEILAFMVEILMQKVKPPYSGEDVHLLKSYCHDTSRSRSMQENSFSTYIASILTNTLNRVQALSASDLSLLWCAVVCSPHFCASQLQAISLLWKELVLQIELCHHEELVKMMLAVLNQMLQSILISTLDSALTMPIDYADILHIVRLRPKSPFSVHMMDLYLSRYQDSSLLTENHLRDVYTLLEPNLVSPSHSIRLITSHILSIFPVDLPEYNDGLTRDGIFKILYEAEKIVPTVHSYREKLVHLRKLDYNCIIKSLPSEFYRKAPLLFLLGNEFWNFKLLWEPLAELICSHAQGLDAEEFWEVMLNQLQEAAHSSERELKIKTAVGHCDEQATVYSLFTQHTSHFLMDTRQPDFANFRLQLWKAMKKFPEKCILRSDALCELYLNFLKNEFSAADEDSMFYQNILHSNVEKCDIQTGESQAETNMDAVMEDTDDEKLHVDIPVVKENETFSGRRKPAIQSLLVHLELIALFKRQRSMFLQSEVQNSLYDLLKHRNSSVQKAAFECILSYKNPHIVPYRDNFYRLLDDKTFKTEIVLFRVDEESTEIKETDRDELLPVLMRILYGKFHCKAGTDTSGKSRSNLRKSIVFSFLCGCKPEELIYFLKLLFQPFMHFFTDDPVKMVSTTLMDINFEKFIPLKRIKGVLNTVQAVSQKLGHRMVKFSHPLLHILLGLTSTVSAALANRTIVLRGAVNLLKTLFHTAVNRITQFFENFENLDYTFEEIDAVFKVVVWPLAHKLATEGIHHPTPLLKLYLFWSQSKRFFPLLGHVKDSSAVDCTPMASIVSLLKAPKINPSVEAAIMDLINNLLHIEDVDEQQMQPLPLPFAVLREREHKAGEHMLLPHISSLIMYLKDSLSKMPCGLSKTRQTFHTELKILGRISTAVTLPEECHALCDLLISLLARGITLSQDTEENILLSFTNMIEYVNKPEAFYRDISQLFCSVERRESRTQLCRLFRVISEKDACLIKYVTLIEKLNAWDKRKTEEPDYFTRLEAFTEINSMLSNMEMVTVDILLPVVYNCCYFINHVDDMSIRDNSTHCLVCIVKCLAHTATEDSRKAFNIAIEKALVPQIKLGVRHKSEAVRHEFLTVLQNLVNSCPDNEMFTGLKHLCDKDTEADFFENIRHIQIHKRSRGLRRLYKHLKDHHFRAEIHMSYFIPLVYAFITDPSYSNHASVQDAAIDLLGAICKQLTWKYYLQLLRFYLHLLPKKIELQKQLVRVIVTLLDAFHFDLKNSNYNITITPAAVVGNMDSLDEGMQQKDTCTDLIPNELPSELEATQTPSYLLQTVVQPDEDEKTDEVTDGSDIICSSAAATRIHKTIVTSLLPQLNKVVTHKAKNDDMHKLVKSKYPEDEEILRVPLALAMIKLLQHLPGGTLENMLPGILLKICVFLRSRSRDVRASARDTIEKVALSLGARFLPFLLRELKAILTRGYQLHILSYTAYRLLKVLSSNMKPGDVDPSLIIVQDIFYSELFGQTADEKEVAAIKSKYFEAQFIKAYDAYQLLATYVSPRNLNQLIQPVKGVLENTHNRHIANKAEVVLLKVAHGLMVNNSIPIETMMVFIKCWVTQSTSRILSQSSHKTTYTDNKDRLQNKLPDSCLLLSEAAPRGGFKPKASKETNTHVLAEFGLQLLHMCLKKSLLLPYEHLHLQLLDPLIPAIQDCLRSSHIKTTANCMRCLSWLLKFPLPSLKANINKIVPDMFLLVQNYTGAATAKGGNQELITVCFKAVTVLVRDVTYYEVTENQLKVLLTYCEEDIYNYSRQSSAFNLIRAILSRKLDTPQLHQVMDRLFEISTTASSSNVRLQSRQVILYYLLNYPLGKGLKKHLYYYIDNLNYELEDGRESAIEMMITMFSAFPQTILNNHCHRFFVALAMASFNDTSSKCRKLLMVALRTLIGKIDMKQRKTLFADVIKWMKSDVVDVCTMGNHVCGIFVEVEGGKFEFYLSDLIPLLQLQLNPNKYTENHEDASKTEQQDMCLVAVLNNLLKIFKELPFARQTNLNDQLNEIWGHVCSQLLYPHSQVRLLCSQLLGLLFSSWEPDEIAKQQKKTCASDENQKPFYMMQDTVQLVKNCTRSFCRQLQTPHLDDILGTQVVKNILYLARLTEALGMLDILVWITKKVMKEANMEVINNVKVTMRRNYAFKWTAALGMSLKTPSVVSLLPYLLPPLQREMLANTQDASLKNLAQEVVDLLKKQVGVPEFTSAFASCHKWRQDKRESKKRITAAEAVTNPDVSARKKIRHNLKKRVAVKRKIEEKRPTKKVKKNKLSILNVVVEDD